MRGDEIRLLFDYNSWANARILEAAAKAGHDAYVAPAAVSFKSLQGTLVHALGVEWLWRQRCQLGVSPKAMPPVTDFPTLEALRERWQAEEAEWREYLRGLPDEDLDHMVHYRMTEGTEVALPLWQLLAHVVNHGTQTRAEAAVVLSARGCSPGDLDLVLFLRQRG